MTKGGGLEVEKEIEPKTFTRAQSLFMRAGANIQRLLHEVLRDERDVMHLKRRSDIHQRIYDHVKRVIK